MPRFTSPLVLLRHAEAEKRDAFALRHDGNPPADDFRPLTEDGVAQTPAIADALRAFGIQVAHSSPATRCMMTITPHFVNDETVNAEPSFSEWGAEKDLDATKERIREVRKTSDPLVICSHRPVLPTLVRGIAGKSSEFLPSRKLKPGDFAVFHRAANPDGTLRKYTILGVEHSNEEF
jgi:8-oxo-dGTP diphosphatase